MVEETIVDLKVDIADEDGIIISDGRKDRCYVYFSEIPSLISILKKLYSDTH